MRSIRYRLLLWVFALVVGIFVILFLMMRDFHRRSFVSTEKLTDQTIESFFMGRWREQAELLAKMWAEQLVRPVYGKDLQAIRDLAIIAGEQELIHRIFVLDDRGIILSDGTWASTLLGTRFADEMAGGGENYRTVRVPIRIGTSELGALVVTFDMTSAAAAVETVHTRTRELFIRQEQAGDARLALLFGIAMLMGLVLAYTLAHGMTKPLHMLSTALERIGRHQYDVSFLPHDREDEIGDLSRTVNRLAEILHSSTVTRKYLEQVLDSMPVGVAITDLAGRILSSNPSFGKICGQAAGDNVADVLHADRGRAAELVAELAERETHGLDIRLEGRGGGRDALLFAVPINGTAEGHERELLLILHDITERKQLEQRLRHLASHDPLTGLPNRRMLFAAIESELVAFRRRGGQPFWLVFVDLDRFKHINDTHGHKIGDRVLEAVAKRLQNVSREEDLVGRLSGDEFLVLLKGEITRRIAVEVAGRILQALRAPLRIGTLQLTVSASVGLTCSNALHGCSDDIVNEADAAMYQAKVRGKDRLITIFDLDQEYCQCNPA